MDADASLNFFVVINRFMANIAVGPEIGIVAMVPRYGLLAKTSLRGFPDILFFFKYSRDKKYSLWP
jgi:hypothetical protein